MRIDIPKKHIEEAIENLRLIESMDFPEVTDSNKMEKIYRMITFAENFGITLFEALEAEEERLDKVTCPHCKGEQCAPPDTYGCTSCGYPGEYE